MESDEEDPTFFIHCINKLNSAMENIKASLEKEELQVIISIMTKLPKKHYKSTIDAMVVKGLSTYMLRLFEKELKASWKRNVKKSEESAEDTTKAMHVHMEEGGKHTGKGFNGKCNHFGKTGHMEKDCWSKHGKP